MAQWVMIRMAVQAMGTQSPPRRAAHALIRLYQLTLSSLLGGQCRYLPSCSAYADEAIRRHGVWAGCWMAAARLCRCHPWGGSGYDPPPKEPPTGASWARPWRYGRWRLDRDKC